MKTWLRPHPSLGAMRDLLLERWRQLWEKERDKEWKPNIGEKNKKKRGKEFEQITKKKRERKGEKGIKKEDDGLIML